MVYIVKDYIFVTYEIEEVEQRTKLINKRKEDDEILDYENKKVI